jgi:hypothetical protein
MSISSNKWSQTRTEGAPLCSSGDLVLLTFQLPHLVSCSMPLRGTIPWRREIPRPAKQYFALFYTMPPGPYKAAF